MSPSLPPLAASLPPELALLIVLDHPARVAALAEHVDWGRMPALARYHRLDGRLASSLEQAEDVRVVPADVRAELLLERDLRRERFDRSVVPQLEEACGEIVAAGIEPILLKGAALICSGAADSGERPMADLDLLVDRSEVAAVSGVLVALGYRKRASADEHVWARANHYQDPAWYHPERPLGVEIHWDLQPPRHRLSFDLATLRTVPLVLPDGTRVRRLSDRDQLTHLVLHFWSDRSYGLPGALGQLWDVRTAAPPDGDPAWGELATVAARRGHAEVLGVVLACSHLLLGGPAPDDLSVARWAKLEETRSFAIRRVLAPRPSHVQLLMVTGDVEHRLSRIVTRVIAQLRKPVPLLLEAYGDLPRWRLRWLHTIRIGRLLLESVRAPLDSRAELRLDRWAHRLR